MNCNDRNKPDNNPALNIFTLPLISEFKFFQFSGRADNTNLVPNFNIIDIRNRYLVIKGIKIVPYYEAASIDMYLGVATETIPANCRINRVFDVYDYGCQLTVLINGVQQRIFPSEVSIFPPAGDGNVPIDLDIDNIFYKYPEKITSFDIRLDAQIFADILNPTTDQPLVKIFVQCYLL
jgi:hypothetical protein